jgi:lipopolysaccharide cholinephosphotransferase
LFFKISPKDNQYFMANKPSLTSANLSKARKVLFTVTSLLDANNIPYHLEGGTLLGIVRDQELLPWDDDVDISVPFEYAQKILKLKWQLLLKGYRLSTRKSKKDVGPIKTGHYSLFKVKPLVGYYFRWFVPGSDLVVLDLFVKAKDNTHTYWQAKEKVMRVENKFYKSFETVNYLGQALKVPNQYREYLTEKYGDWSVPVKEWNCGENELTIVRS